MEGKTTNRHVFLRMVREVEMSRDWFRSVFIVNLNIPKVFAETITQSAARFEVLKNERENAVKSNVSDALQ